MTEFRGEKKKERNIDCYVSGASDPYVKVKSGGRLLHKSRTVHRDLNPVWDESVTLPIEDPFQPLTFKVNFSIVPFVRTINPSIIIIIIITRELPVNRPPLWYPCNELAIRIIIFLPISSKTIIAIILSNEESILLNRSHTMSFLIN